ncbi:SufE family protein [Georgenia sp. MJ170]|uniref:SufE family protein n=1 Tax=Georgenia sunbinii TaxID=3117728 RepID=UPI002F263E25
MTTAAEGLPDQLAEIVDDFTAMSVPDRLQLLVEFGQELPALPERYAAHLELLEAVQECQSPVYLLAEVVVSDDEPVVRLHISAPPQALTTRGFAGVLHAALDGLPAAQVLAVPIDVTDQLGLGEAVSPLRLRGMAAMLGRIQRQVREKS